MASRVHILEPQWNPSIENQAIGRVLRIGQDKKVSVVRYIVQGTIEEASSGGPDDNGVQKANMAVPRQLKVDNT